jgi:hypothetical protein
MSRFRADVRTEHASRYLQQLCKHWSHRFQVEFDAARGVVRMNGADCTFHAEPQRLSMTLEGEDRQALPRLCDVVTEHLKRFAFREQIDVPWVEAELA